MRRHLRAPHAPVHRSTEDRGAQATFIIMGTIVAIELAITAWAIARLLWGGYV